MTDDLISGLGNMAMGLQELVTNPRLDSTSQHLSPEGRHSPGTAGNDLLADVQSSRKTSIYQFGPIGHHPQDVGEIHRLRQKIMTMETARYIGDNNAVAQPKGPKSPSPGDRQARNPQTQLGRQSNPVVQ